VFRTALRAAGIAYVAYLAFSVLVILPALNFLPAWYVKETYNRQLSTEIVLFNPFTLSLEARHMALPELDGERFASLELAAVNLSLESLWHPGWVFDAVVVDRLYLHVRRLQDGSTNFSDFIPPDPEEPDEQSGGEIPGITIHRFAFHSDQIRLTNENREKPFSTRYENLEIAVNDLSTVIEEGKPYTINAAGEDGGSLHWAGVVSVPGQYSEGKLVLSDLSLHNTWRFLEPWVQFELIEARLGIQGNYSLQWREELIFHITDGVLQVSGIDIDPKISTDIPDTTVDLNLFKMSGMNIDGARQHVAIEAVTVQGLVVEGWSEGSRLSLAELFAFQGDEAPSAATDEPDSSSPWTADVASIALGDSRVEWRSEYTDPPQMAITPIEIQINNLRWPFDQETDLSLEIALNEQARVTLQGALALASGAGAIDYTLEDLPLTWFNPNLPAGLRAQITDGFARMEGQLTLDEFAPTQLATGGAITAFAGRIADEASSSTSWETVRWRDLEVDLIKREVNMQKLSIDDYAGRLHIREDGSINTQNVWAEEVGEEAEELATELNQGEPWKISIPTIRVTDSQIDFMDESLPIHFRTVIGDLNGEVLGISTQAGAVAQVNLQGSVDGYAPVVLAGSAEPFSTPLALDLALSFDGIDMALLTPYSGTYAGHAIERGLLNLHLKYALQEGHLEGHNRVVIGQLKLGEKIQSEQAVDLPLELALALLTDSNGVIDIDLPVSGNIDEPDFDIGSVIAGAFVNLITKAVTAPFALLANMIGSEEDLQRLNFPSGMAELDEAGKTKLTQLGGALTQRPGLILVIKGRLHPRADRERLQERQLINELVGNGLTPEQVQTKGPEWEKAVRARYTQLSGPNTAETPLGQQYEAVRDSIPTPDTALRELIEARAVAVKTYLVNEVKLEADRAVIEQVSLDDEAHLFSGVELGVDS